jgi:hypothetical protein
MVHAFLGRRRWLKVKRKYDVEKNGVYVVMMPDADRELNEAALRNIDGFLDYRKGNKAVILTTDEWVMDNSPGFSNRIEAVERISERDYNYYYSYYYYYYYFGFSEKFILMSLQGIHGKRLALAENVNGITKEELACIGLYVIRNWSKAG